MIRRRSFHIFQICAAILLFAQSQSHGQENMRVAYPSMSASVIILMIANKEGYYKEEGLNLEFLSIRGEIAIRIALAGEIDYFTNAGSALTTKICSSRLCSGIMKKSRSAGRHSRPACLSRRASSLLITDFPFC
jgi:hypothetical protein